MGAVEAKSSNETRDSVQIKIRFRGLIALDFTDAQSPKNFVYQLEFTKR